VTGVNRPPGHDRHTHYDCCCKREEKNIKVKKEKVVSMSVVSMVLHLLDYMGQRGFKYRDITAAKTICTIQWGLNKFTATSHCYTLLLKINASCLKNTKYNVKFCKNIKKHILGYMFFYRSCVFSLYPGQIGLYSIYITTN